MSTVLALGTKEIENRTTVHYDYWRQPIHVARVVEIVDRDILILALRENPAPEGDLVWRTVNESVHDSLPRRLVRSRVLVIGAAFASSRVKTLGRCAGHRHVDSAPQCTCIFSALQLMKAAYWNGHVSAATEAEGHAAMLLD
ncbi:hypothetical protein BDR05DRAFT_958152 [Suillus weaverae]|nr:hypothetical protein BDR05DRAFT_958152 [Suillus weaverae]